MILSQDQLEQILEAMRRENATEVEVVEEKGKLRVRQVVTQRTFKPMPLTKRSSPQRQSVSA